MNNWLSRIGLAMGIVGIILMGVAFYRIGYKDGQIDALSGTVKYELQQTWTKIP